MKKKLLLLTPHFPFPAYDGGRLRILNLVRRLRRDFDVYLLSFRSPGDCPAGIAKYCRGVYTVPFPGRTVIPDDQLPMIVQSYYAGEMLAMARKVADMVRPDIVQVEYVLMAPYADCFPGAKVIFTEHDAASLDFALSPHNRDLPHRERFLEWGRVVDYERRVLRRADHVLAVTRDDARLLRRALPACRPVVIPTGVDCRRFRFAAPPAGHARRLVFIGHFGHFPNVEATAYFLEKVFPAVRAVVPDVEFDIVGSNMNRSLRRLRMPGVRVVGQVEDVRKYLRGAAVFVAPLRFGGGIRGKIFEAMAAGVPVVATRQGGVGVNGARGREILIARDDADFARQVVRLLGDGRLRRRIARSARRLVEREYDWDGIAGRLVGFYRGITDGRKRAGGRRKRKG